jgi:hypothetical protein
MLLKSPENLNSTVRGWAPDRIERWGLPPYRALARELNFCNGGGYGCGRISQAINGLAEAENLIFGA